MAPPVEYNELDPRPALQQVGSVWAAIEAHPEYKKLSPELQAEMKQDYYATRVVTNPAIKQAMQEEPVFGNVLQHTFFAKEEYQQTQREQESEQRNVRLTAQPTAPVFEKAFGITPATEVPPEQWLRRGLQSTAEGLSSTENLALFAAMRYAPGAGAVGLARAGFAAPTIARVGKLTGAGIDAYFAYKMGQGVLEHGSAISQLSEQADKFEAAGDKENAELYRNLMRQQIVEGLATAGMTYLAGRGAAKNLREGISPRPITSEALPEVKAKQSPASALFRAKSLDTESPAIPFNKITASQQEVETSKAEASPVEPEKAAPVRPVVSKPAIIPPSEPGGPEVIPPKVQVPADVEPFKDLQFAQARQNFKQATVESKSLQWAVDHGQGNEESIKRLDMLERRKDQALLDAIQSQPPEAAKETLTSLLTVANDLQTRGKKLQQISADLLLNRRVIRQGRVLESQQDKRVSLPEINELLGKAFRRPTMSDADVQTINDTFKAKDPDFQPLDPTKANDKRQLQTYTSAMYIHAEGVKLEAKGDRYARSVQAGAQYHKIPLESLAPRVRIPQEVAKPPVEAPAPQPAAEAPVSMRPGSAVVNVEFATSRLANLAGVQRFGEGKFRVVEKGLLSGKTVYRVEPMEATPTVAPKIVEAPKPAKEVAKPKAPVAPPPNLSPTQATYKSYEAELQKLGKGELIDTLRSDVQSADEIPAEKKAAVYAASLKRALDIAKSPVTKPGEVVAETPRQAGFEAVREAASKEPLDHGTIYQIYLKAKNEGVERVNREMWGKVHDQTGAKTVNELGRWVENNWPKEEPKPSANVTGSPELAPRTVPIVRDTVPAKEIARTPTPEVSQAFLQKAIELAKKIKVGEVKVPAKTPEIKLEPPSEGLIQSFIRKGYSREEAINKATDFKLGRASGRIGEAPKPAKQIAPNIKAPKGISQSGFDMIKQAVVDKGGPAVERLKLMKDALGIYKKGMGDKDPMALKNALEHVRQAQLAVLPKVESVPLGTIRETFDKLMTGRKGEIDPKVLDSIKQQTGATTIAELRDYINKNKPVEEENAGPLFKPSSEDEPLRDTFKEAQDEREALAEKQRNRAATFRADFNDRVLPFRNVSPLDAETLGNLEGIRQEHLRYLHGLILSAVHEVPEETLGLQKILNTTSIADNPESLQAWQKLQNVNPGLAHELLSSVGRLQDLNDHMRDFEGSKAKEFYNKPTTPIEQKFIDRLLHPFKVINDAAARKYAEANIPDNLKDVLESRKVQVSGRAIKEMPGNVGEWHRTMGQNYINVRGIGLIDQIRNFVRGEDSIASTAAHETGHVLWEDIRRSLGGLEPATRIIRKFVDAFPEPAKEIWQAYAREGRSLTQKLPESNHEIFAQTFEHWFDGKLSDQQRFTEFLGKALKKANYSNDLIQKILALEGTGKDFRPPIASIPFSFNDIRAAELTGDGSRGMPMSSPAEIAKSIIPPEEPGEKEVAKGLVREYSGGLRRGRDILYKQYEDALKTYDKFSIDDFKDWTHIYQKEDWSNFTPAARKLAESIKSGFQERTAIIQNMTGDFLDYYKNYLPGMWENERTAGDYFERMVFSKRQLAGKAFFKQHKTYEFFDEAMNAGLKPITNNPARMALIALANMDKYIMGHRMVDEMKAEGLISFIKRGQKIPTDWLRLDDPIFKPFFRVKDTSLTASAGEYFAHKDTARILNNYLSPGLRGNWAFDTLRKYSNFMNQFQLGWSGFHFTFTNLDAASSDLALGIEKIFKRGDMTGVGNSLRSFIPFLSGHHAYRIGKMLQEEWDVPGTHPQISQLANNLERAGFATHQDPFYYNDAATAFKKALTDKNYASIPMKFANAAVEFSSKWLMEKVVPRMKAGVAMQLIANKLTELNEKDITDPNQVRMAIDRVVDSVDNRMGQMIYDNLFWPKMAKDLGFIGIRSLGWNIGTFRELAGGAVDWANYVGGKVTGKNRELTHRMAYVVAMPIVTGFYGAVLNYLYTGQAPQQKEDYFFPRTGEIGPDGKPERLSIPSYMRDVWAFSHDPGRTVLHKMHPIWSSVYEMLSNQDFYGEEIRHKEDPLIQQAGQVMKYAGKQLMPIGVRSGYQRLKSDPGISVTKAFLSTELGLVPAPRYIGESKAEIMAFEYAHRHMEQGPRSEQETERRQTMLQLRNQINKGQLTGEGITKALQTGRVTTQDINKLYKQRGESPLERATKQLTIEEALSVWKEATPEEKQKIMPILMQKMKATHGKPMLPEERLKLNQDFYHALSQR